MSTTPLGAVGWGLGWQNIGSNWDAVNSMTTLSQLGIISVLYEMECNEIFQINTFLEYRKLLAPEEINLS